MSTLKVLCARTGSFILLPDINIHAPTHIEGPGAIFDKKPRVGRIMRVYYLNLKKIKRKAILAGLFLLVAFLLTMVLWREPLTPATGKHSGIIYKVKTDKKVCALTFDIGWGDKVPARCSTF